MPGLFRRLIAPKPRSVERDSVTLVLQDARTIEILRVRDPRARRIKLSVDERGARLTLPPRASLVSGDRFLHEHRQWLSLQLQKYSNDDALPALVRDQTASLPLRGGQATLCWHEGRYARLTLRWRRRAALPCAVPRQRRDLAPRPARVLRSPGACRHWPLAAEIPARAATRPGRGSA